MVPKIDSELRVSILDLIKTKLSGRQIVEVLRDRNKTVSKAVVNKVIRENATEEAGYPTLPYPTLPYLMLPYITPSHTVKKVYSWLTDPGIKSFMKG